LRKSLREGYDGGEGGGRAVDAGPQRQDDPRRDAEAIPAAEPVKMYGQSRMSSTETPNYVANSATVPAAVRHHHALHRAQLDRRDRSPACERTKAT
jgi:hypothetical protein